MLSKLLTIAALTVLSTVSAIQLTIPGPGGPGGLPNTGCPGGVLGCVPNPCADGKCGDD